MDGKSDLPKVKTDLPGPKSRPIIERYHECFGGKRPPRIAMAKTYGCIVEDMDGNKFLDLSQISCVSGCSNPEIIEAATKQMTKAIPRNTASPTLVELTEKLLTKLPGELSRGRVNHLASGSETVEFAIQIVRAYTGRPIILSYHDSHHGFIGTPFQVSSDPGIKRSWRAKISDVVHIPYPTCYRCPFKQEYPNCDMMCLRYFETTLEAVALPDQVAGLLIEPVLVNGGMFVPPKEYMVGVSDICKKHGIQLIIDEVYTGIGKSGRFMTFEYWDLVPDVVCLGKALGGGFPLAAVVTRREVIDRVQGGVRFMGTFAGNLVACAAATANLEYLERCRLVENAQKVGGFLMESFKELSSSKRFLGDVRGSGLLLGLDLVEDKESRKPNVTLASRVVDKALREGLILRSRGRYGNVLLLTPPLTITMEQAQFTVDILGSLID